MICFACLRVWQRIRARLSQNLWLLLRLTAGFALLFFSIALIQSAQQSKEDERYSNSSLKRLTIISHTGNILQEQALSQADISNLSSAFSHVQFVQLMVGDLGISGTDILRFDRILLASPALKNQLGILAPPDSQSLKLLQDAVVRPQGDVDFMACLQQSLDKRQVFLLQPNAFAQNVIGLRRSEETDYAGKLWLFVVEGLMPVGSHNLPLFNYALLPESDEAHNLLTSAEIQLHLARAFPKARAMVLNADEKVALSVQKATSSGQQLLYLTALVLTVVMIGMLGNYLILCDRRRQEFAILYSMGVPRRVLIFELLLENVGLFFLAWMLSTLPGQAMLHQTSFPGLALKTTPSSILIPLVGSILLSCLVTWLGIRTAILHTPTAGLKGG